MRCRVRGSARWSARADPTVLDNRRTSDDQRHPQRGRRQDGQVGRGDPRGVRRDPGRSGAAEHVQQDPGGLLRHPDPAAAARVVHRARGADHHHRPPTTWARWPTSRRRSATPTSGVNPANDGKVLRCVFPELSEERRKEYIKVAKAKAEDGRVAVRNLRRTAKQHLEKLEKDGEAGKDDVTGAEKRLDSHDQDAHRRHRRAAEEQGSRAARGLSASRDLTLDDRHLPGCPRAPEGPRPRRPRPQGGGRLGRRAARRDRRLAGVLEAGVHVHRGRRGGRRDLGAAPGPARQGHRHPRAAADARRRGHGRRRLPVGRPGAGHRHRGHRAGDDAVAAAARDRRLRPDLHRVGVHARLRAVPRLVRGPAARRGRPRTAAASTTTASPGSSRSSWSRSPPTSAATSPACCSASTRWRR